MKTPLEILRHYWGYTQFRPLQEEIIQSVLAGQDTLAILPTGGGKSVCFQVPGLLKDGVTLVVSPLIALIKDQVEHLRRRGIKAAAIHSGLTRREIDMHLDNCVYGDTRFLYVSPERLDTEMFRMRLERMHVTLLAVDEAHCISQWGYDFRPSYLRIANIREILKNVPVLALTATATPQVQEDICEKLCMSHPQRFQASFERKNIVYVVREIENKLEKIREILSKVPGSAIIYAATRRRTVEIADYLYRHHFSADYYHAGLKPEQRAQRQDAWIADRIRIMVSTNAFGMGIDKPDVRCVIHADLPESIEAYYQEAGRAGRDGKRAYAILLYNASDKIHFEQKLQSYFPSFEELRHIYDALGNYFKIAVGSGQGESYEFNIGSFAAAFSFSVQKVIQALHLLEHQGIISITEAVYLPSRFRFTADKETLYRFQVKHADYDLLIKLLLRTAPGILDDYVVIQENQLARVLQCSVTEVEQKLNFLQQMDLADYRHASDLPLITFLQPRTFSKYLHIDKSFVEQRKSVLETRLTSMLSYARNKIICRSKWILAYFGEEGQRCGTCDICIKLNKMNISELKFNELYSRIQNTLTRQPVGISELYDVLSAFPKENILYMIKWLTDNGHICKNQEGNLSWVD